MKLCSFCGTENAADAVKCSSCGGNEFKYKCDNCGTVFTEGVHCPHCGVKAGQEARTCPVCHTEYYSNACPNCGYIPSAKKAADDQTVHTAVGVRPPVNYVSPQTVQVNVQPQKPKRKTWLWVLGWIFIFPLPLTLILVKKEDMNKALKYALIIGAWVLYAIIAVASRAGQG